METIQLKCDVIPTDYTSNSSPLVFEIKVNNDTRWSSTITEITPIEVDITSNDDEEVKVEFVLSGKTTEHTTVDENGKIISDARLQVENIAIDEIALDEILENQKLPYYHNFNGNGKDTVDQFLNVLGCNGTAEFKFTTPFYLWLLENM
jgi:hypothetical protein